MTNYERDTKLRRVNNGSVCSTNGCNEVIKFEESIFIEFWRCRNQQFCEKHREEARKLNDDYKEASIQRGKASSKMQNNDIRKGWGSKVLFSPYPKVCEKAYWAAKRERDLRKKYKELHVPPNQSDVGHQDRVDACDFIFNRIKEQWREGMRLRPRPQKNEVEGEKWGAGEEGEQWGAGRINWDEKDEEEEEAKKEEEEEGEKE